MARSPPLDVETKYRRLLDVLEGPVSDRWAVVQIDAFLAHLGPRTPEAESYLLSLAEPLAERAGELDPVGLHPDQLARLAGRLRAAQAAHPILREGEALPRAERSLRRRAGLLYGYAGAVDRAVECLPSSEPPPALTDATAEAPKAEPAPRARLREALERTEAPDVAQELRWVLGHWEQKAEDGTCVPVVERLPSWARSERGDGPTVGALRRLAVQIHGPAESSDRIRADASVRGAEDRSLTEAPITAARRRLRERFSGLKGRYVEGRMVFAPAESEHEGQSAGLALAALFYSAVLEQERCRVRVKVRPEVLLTGEVGPEGAVRPVSDDGLSVKVQTAFFSPKSSLVVPAVQQEAAEAARDELRRDFPGGRLDIVGVDRLKALFYDRRLTRLDRIGWARHTAQRLWDRRSKIVAGTVIAALLIVIAGLLYGPIDKNPVAVSFAGTEMLLKNESGHVLERIAVGERFATSARQNQNHAYRLGDIDGDGRNDICWRSRPKEGQQTAHRLQCKGVGEDTLRWSFRTTYDVSFPRKPAVVNEQFETEYLRIGDFDADKRIDLFALLRHTTYFPYLVLKLDAATGREEQRYLHPGFLDSPAIIDLNGDGIDELLMTGLSNAYDQAVFTVLDARYVQGHGPTRGDYVIEGMGPAREVVYLRIPPTVVDRAQPGVVNRGFKVDLETGEGFFQVYVHDGQRPDIESRAANILIHMDARFEPIGIGTSSRYDYLAERLVKQGRLNSVPDYDYFQRYQQQFRYWTGSGWTSAPTVNARWRAAAGTAWSPDTLTAARAAALPDSARTTESDP